MLPWRTAAGNWLHWFPTWFVCVSVVPSSPTMAVSNCNSSHGVFSFSAAVKQKSAFAPVVRPPASPPPPNCSANNTNGLQGTTAPPPPPPPCAVHYPLSFIPLTAISNRLKIHWITRPPLRHLVIYPPTTSSIFFVLLLLFSCSQTLSTPACPLVNISRFKIIILNNS